MPVMSAFFMRAFKKREGDGNHSDCKDTGAGEQWLLGPRLTDEASTAILPYATGKANGRTRKETMMPDELEAWQPIGTSLLLARPPWLAVYQDKVRLPGGRILDDFY